MPPLPTHSPFHARLFHLLFSSIRSPRRLNILSVARKSYSSSSSVGNDRKMSHTYPQARRDSTVREVIHGVEVADPYRWLEDPDSEETKKFVDAQNAITMPYIESCPDRQKIKNRLTELWDYPKYGCPFKRGDNYFYYMNSGLQNQSVLYKQASLDAESTVFLDPNTLSDDGTTSISVSSFSEDGKWFAYGLSDAGSDWIRIKIRSVETGKDCLEEVKRCKFTSISWTHDNLGFFYAYYADDGSKSDGTETNANENQKLYYHKINTPQSEDILVLEFPDQPKWRSGITVSECGNYANVFIRVGCQDVQWYYAKIPQTMGKLAIHPIYDKFDSEFDYITNDGEIFYALTNNNAPNYRVIKFNLNDVAPTSWLDVVPENKKDVLEWTHCVNSNVLILGYLRDVTSRIQLRDLASGSLIRELDIPIGSVSSLTGKRKQSEIFFQMTSFLTPGLIYHFDLAKDQDPKIFRDTSKYLKNFDASKFKQEQVFYSSKDGTKIPMFIVSKKDTPQDSSAPCLLYAYGGFNISILPAFSISRLLWMERFNGVLAVANIRGGSEYGQAWHDGGRLFNKQNCFNDFAAAAEFLIDQKYTSKDKLVIQGGSNGGLLVGACMNQRPDLFGVGIAHVGVMDMLRFHKFTIGHAWCTDYGNPDEKEHFENLRKISPLHNIPSDPPTYPATLLLTADHDDRVVPLHSLKFIANLQHTLGSKVTDKPLYIRVDTKAGHGAGKPTTKLIEEYTDIYCFLAKTLGIRYQD